jgi:hypothetical protein
MAEAMISLLHITSACSVRVESAGLGIEPRVSSSGSRSHAPSPNASNPNLIGGIIAGAGQPRYDFWP